MKLYKFIIALSLFTVAILPTTAQDSDKKTEVTTETAKVSVYYFHYTRRCATCNSVESVAKEAVAEYFKDIAVFAEYNLDTPEGEKKGESVGASSQALLIVVDGKTVDITNEGFMNARSNPEKLKATIKEKIEALL